MWYSSVNNTNFRSKSVLFGQAKKLDNIYFMFSATIIIDFSKLAYSVERQDSKDVRQKILSISYSEWKKMRFSKGTLHYMKKNAEADKPFTMNAHVRDRLEMWQRY